MAPRLGSYFCGPHLYSHNNINPDPESVCIVCREPFTEEGAIRLTSCSHIIGAKCFREWVRHHTNTCPYWNHSLPTPTSSRSILEWACNHEWFKNHEELVHILVNDGNGGPELIASLDALHGDRLSFQDFRRIIWSFWLKACFVTAIIVMIALSAIGVVSISLWTIIALPMVFPLAGEFRAWLPFSCLLKSLRLFDILITSIGMLAVASFTTIVLAVLVLSMWRWLPQPWGGKQPIVGAWKKSTDKRDE